VALVLSVAQDKRRSEIWAPRKLAADRLWPILLKNSVRELERAPSQKSSSQIEARIDDREVGKGQATPANGP
jgi:hypothetical protein